MISLCCPACGADLSRLSDAYQCAMCGHRYPVVLGIPDLRVFPDPYINVEDDRAKGTRVLEDTQDGDFERVVRHYWELTPDVPRNLVDSYVSHVLAACDRAEAILAEAELTRQQLSTQTASGAHTLLEIGCGTGGLLIAGARQYEHVVGVDIAFRWLAIATRRIEQAVQTGELTREQAGRIQLLCACAERLPLPSGTFDLVVGASTVEHTLRPADVFAEARRALVPGGGLFLTTVNRLSLAPEPHVNVWGVGFLPRRLMEAYVRRVRGVPYHNIHLQSSLEFSRLLRGAGFAAWRVYPATLAEVDLARYSPAVRLGARLYSRLGKLPISRQALTVFGPLLHVAAINQGAQPGLNRRSTVRAVGQT